MMVSMTSTPDHLARAERLALCDTLDRVGPDAPTLCDPWDARMLAAHIVLRERRPDLAPGIVLPLLAGRLDRAQASMARQTPWTDLVHRVRTGPPAWSPTRVPSVDDVVNTVEMIIHHEDLLRGDGRPGPRRDVSPELAKAAWSALRRMASLMFRRTPVGVELVAPGFRAITARQGTPVVTVTGEPVELLLVAYGRERVAAVEYDGAAAAVDALLATPLGI